MPKTKKRIQKSADTFTTFSGKTMNRRELSRKIYRANQAIKKSRSYLTSREYKMMKEQYENLVEEAIGKDNTYLTIKGIDDVRKLKRIEQAATRLLSYTHLNKSKYNKMVAKQRASLQASLSQEETIKENGKLKTIRKNRLTDNQMDNLRDFIFSSNEWHHLVENELLDSHQAIEMFLQRGFLDQQFQAELVTMALSSIESRMSKNPNLNFEDALIEELNNYGR